MASGSGSSSGAAGSTGTTGVSTMAGSTTSASGSGPATSSDLASGTVAPASSVVTSAAGGLTEATPLVTASGTAADTALSTAGSLLTVPMGATAGGEVSRVGVMPPAPPVVVPPVVVYPASAASVSPGAAAAVVGAGAASGSAVPIAGGVGAGPAGAALGGRPVTITVDDLTTHLGAAFGLFNGTFNMVPTASVTQYIDPANVLILVLDDAGANPRYNPVAQMAYMVAGGTDPSVGAIMAGLRAGVFSGMKLCNWVTAGNKYSAVKAHIEAGTTLVPGKPPAAVPGLPRLVWENPADESTLAVTFSRQKVIHAHQLFRQNDWVTDVGFAFTIRADEVRHLPPDYQFPANVQAAIQDPESLKQYKEAAQFALTALGLVAYHLSRADNHYWMSRTANAATNYLNKAMAASKLSITKAQLNAALHDAFHWLFNLAQVFHSMMSMPEMQGAFSQAAFFRYPFVMPGTAVIGASMELLTQTREIAGQYNVTPEYGAILTALHTGLQAASADVQAQPMSWSEINNPQRTQRDIKLAAAKRLGAFILGSGIGWGISEDATIRKAPSLTMAGSMHPAMLQTGQRLAAAMRARGHNDNPAAADLSLTEAITALTENWV